MSLAVKFKENYSKSAFAVNSMGMIPDNDLLLNLKEMTLIMSSLLADKFKGND